MIWNSFNFGLPYRFRQRFVAKERTKSIFDTKNIETLNTDLKAIWISYLNHEQAEPKLHTQALWYWESLPVRKGLNN